MKREYVKPTIYFESFSLCTNIAGDCEARLNTQSNNDCGYYAEGLGIIFMDNMNGCKVKMGDGLYEGICYDVPTDDRSLFIS